MLTSSFFAYQGAGRVSIARSAPRNVLAGYKVFSQLAPSKEMLGMEYAEYRELYFLRILGKLDPKQTFDRLHELAGGADPVLLCWERPPLTEKNWCHRRLVAEWFGETLGIDVPEHVPPAAIKKRKNQLLQL